VLNSVGFGDGSHIIAVGNGVIAECNNADCNTAASTHWATETVSGISSSANLTDVSMLGTNGPAVVVGAGGVIGYCSATCVATGTVTWTSETSNTTQNLLGVSALAGGSLTTAVAVGANGDFTTGTSATSWFSPTATLSTLTGAHAGGTVVTVSSSAGFSTTVGTAITVTFTGSTTALTLSPASVVTTAGGASNPSTFTFTTPAQSGAGTYEIVISDAKGDAVAFSFLMQ
jgi:hypothetical protein